MIWEKSRKWWMQCFCLSSFHLPCLIEFDILGHYCATLLSKNTCSTLDRTQVQHDIYYLIFNKQIRREDKRAKQNKANLLFYWMQIRFQIWKTFKKNFRCLWPKITSAPLYLYKEGKREESGEWRECMRRPRRRRKKNTQFAFDL